MPARVNPTRRLRLSQRSEAVPVPSAIEVVLPSSSNVNAARPNVS